MMLSVSQKVNCCKKVKQDFAQAGWPSFCLLHQKLKAYLALPNYRTAAHYSIASTLCVVFMLVV